jgi:S1-C subfamily serine protease
MLYTPHTTVAGIVEKAGEWPYNAPPALLEAAPSAPESRWADDTLGDVPVNFLTDLDTTGGNSGSATLNAKGELVGLIFDGTYESMTGDWAFDAEQVRSIHVDIRYMLWLLESVEAATHIVDELNPPQE